MLVSALVHAAFVFFFAWGLPAVHSRFHSITFSSVEQCGNFSVHFAGGEDLPPLPLTLTVVPFDSTPLSIEVPIFSWNFTTATGAMVTFLPLAAGTKFIASLDDTLGQPTGLVSDVIEVGLSSNTSCLVNSPAPSARYTLPDSATYSQCSPFNVSYDPTVASGPPGIRALIPNNSSFTIDRIGQTVGCATYTMNAPHGKQVVLVLGDDTGYFQSSSLFVVGGDNTFTTRCLPFVATAQVPAPHDGLSRTAVIAIAVVTGTVVGGIALTMGIWSCLHRRAKVRTNSEKLKAADPDPEARGDSIKKTDTLPSIGAPTKSRRLFSQFVQNPPLATLRSRHGNNVSQVPRYRAPLAARCSSGLRSLILLQPGRSSPPGPDLGSPPVPPLPTTLFTEQPELSRSNSGSTLHSPTEQELTPRTRHPTSVSSEDIEYMLEMGSLIPSAVLKSFPSPHPMETTTPAASDSHSDIIGSSLGIVRLNVRVHPSRGWHAERPLPRLPIPSWFLPSSSHSPRPRPPRESTQSSLLLARPTSPNPSFVRTSDGRVVTNVYESSNWVARSIPSSPDTPISTPTPVALKLLPSAYRDPPQAHVPTSPFSEVYAASVFSASTGTRSRRI